MKIAEYIDHKLHGFIVVVMFIGCGGLVVRVQNCRLRGSIAATLKRQFCTPIFACLLEETLEAVKSLLPCVYARGS